MQQPGASGNGNRKRSGRRSDGEAGAGPQVGSRGARPPTTSVSPPRGPQCGGWLGSLFGQCCIHQQEAVEAELREPPVSTGDHALVESSEPYFHQNRDAQNQRQVGPGGALQEPRAGEPGGPRGAGGGRGQASSAAPDGRTQKGAEAPEKTGPVRQFVIDNSILKIQGPPGVAYRYTKRRTDKVRGEGEANVSVAKWGDIVQGVDQGDGWLKVGQLYLPMTHDGVAVISLVDEAMEPSLREPGKAAAPPRAGKPAAKASVKPGAAAASAPSPFEAPPAPPPPPTPSAPPAPAAPAAAEADPRAVASLQATQPAATTSPVATGADFRLMPSVGTWMQPLPLRRLAAAKAAPATASPAVPAPAAWKFKPSVGTWLQAKPQGLVRLIERDAESVLQFGNIQEDEHFKAKMEVDTDTGVGGSTPSTISPDSPFN